MNGSKTLITFALRIINEAGTTIMRNKLDT